ncbi:MAG TPA: hypothetical protein VJG64_01965 [Candidatus Paceibacterota bacterium]
MREEFTHRKAKLEGETGDHFNNLYDEDEDRAGQKINEATGKRINNTPVVSGMDEQLTVQKIKRGRSEDVLGKLSEKNDAAARWLREHGDDTQEAA